LVVNGESVYVVVVVMKSQPCPQSRTSPRAGVRLGEWSDIFPSIFSLGSLILDPLILVSS
jgi:hypothetical protein